MVALEDTRGDDNDNLQQQKSYGGFRDKIGDDESFIYNSRNLMVALESLNGTLLSLSTTVEILWWLQR